MPVMRKKPAAGGPTTLPLPHERDEGGNAVAATPDPVIEQAKRDLDRGLVDTDMRATPGLDAQRRQQLVPTPGSVQGADDDPGAGTTAGSASGPRGTTRPSSST